MSVCVAVLFVGIRSAAAQSAAIEGRIVDEPRSHSVIDTADPFAPVEFGPSAAAARHRASISAIAPVGWGVQVAPIFYYRSALPVSLIEGLDRNNDFNNNELPDRRAVVVRQVADCRIRRPRTTICCSRQFTHNRRESS